MSKTEIENAVEELNELRRRASNIEGFILSIRVNRTPKFVKIVFPRYWSEKHENFPREYTRLMYEFLTKELSITDKKILAIERKMEKVKL